MIEIRQLNAVEGARYLGELADVLIDCVEGGASVGFMPPLSRAAAKSFFQTCLLATQDSEAIFLAAFLDSTLVGTVQVRPASPPNQPYRADVAKLLVRRSARGRGVGRCLVENAEQCSRSAGRTLLVLDTAAGASGEALYTRLGWTRAGAIPKYALYPDGTWCDTVIFWKDVS